MDLFIEKRYLKLPVSPYAQNKTLTFHRDGQLVLDFSTRLDPISPVYWFYWDMRLFMGQNLTFSTVPTIAFQPEFVEEIPADSHYDERLRPAAHFTAHRGWLNDPNGCVFYEGQYHMFFQHNPVDSCWGNMSWGHAVSPDLIHWEQREIALFPDEFGTMYSGSAVVDHNNVSGLQENGHAPLLLFYTAAGRHSLLSAEQNFCQCLAYSTDGGNTFQKYDKNPIVPHIASGNRDPKVIYNPEENCYYMSLYLVENEYALFRSGNLLDWSRSQRIDLPGDGECPDFFPLTCQGETYWIFIGASDRYLVGRMENGRFVPVQEARSLQSRGRSYAAQTFSNVPGGRCLRIAWNQTNIPHTPFTCAMCTPTEMTLVKDSRGFWLRTNPIDELDTVHRDNTAPILCGKAQDIRLKLRWKPYTSISLKLLGLEMVLSQETNSLTVNGVTLPLHAADNTISLRFITDVHAVEIYTADGRSFTCVDHLADYNLNTLSLTAQCGDFELLEQTVLELENIWK